MEEKIFSYLEKELSSQLGNDFKITGEQYVGGGCISSAVKLKTTKGDLFLKWNSSCEKDMFLREAEGLKELKKHAQGTLAIPEIYFSKAIDSLPGMIVMEFLPSGSTTNQDEKLGQGLATLHQYSGNQFGFDHDNYCGSTIQPNDWSKNWIEFFTNKRIKHLLKLIGHGYTNSEYEVFERLLQRLPDLLLTDSQPSLIHGDLWSGNYMYTSFGPSIIDPAAYYADREMELSMMQMFGGFSPRVWSAYQEAFPLEQGWEDRVQIYQLWHILNHYYLFGGHYGNQALAVAKRYVKE